MMTQEFRELLDRTGVLFTRVPDDPGHIPDFWRKKIHELCDLVESAPLDIADTLAEERAEHERTRAAVADHAGAIAELKIRLTSAERGLAEASDKSHAAVRLVEDAVPRMKTLNNAMSPDWLRRAGEFLGN